MMYPVVYKRSSNAPSISFAEHTVFALTALMPINALLLMISYMFVIYSKGMAFEKHVCGTFGNEPQQ